MVNSHRFWTNGRLVGECSNGKLSIWRYVKKFFEEATDLAKRSAKCDKKLVEFIKIVTEDSTIPMETDELLAIKTTAEELNDTKKDLNAKLTLMSGPYKYTVNVWDPQQEKVNVCGPQQERLTCVTLNKKPKGA